MTAASNINNNNNNGGAPATAAASRQEVADVLEERLIDAEYKIWKKNTPFLYDFVLTHALEWPSLTCQFLPAVRKAGDTAEELSLLLGTHTTGEQNYLMMASCVIPTPDDVVASGGGNGNADNGTTATDAHYDEERNEMGGFGRNPNSSVGKIEVKMKVKHEGEVNRARHMPQNHFIVATRGPSPEVYIFDMSKHPSFPADNATFAPQGVCVGHAQEGYGLCWSPQQQGYLISGSEDKKLCLWNVETVIGKGVASNQPGTQIPAMATFTGHTDVVEDVDWHHKDPNMVGSVGDDKTIRLWDIRKSGSSEAQVHIVSNAHDNDINCIAFNPVKEFLLATGSADKTVAIWDMRNLKS
jgi:histone-binding protein RBBP4